MCDELEAELREHAFKRRKSLGSRSIKKSRPFRDVSDFETIIQICTRKLMKDPRHVRALTLRASSYLKKNCIEDCIQDCNNLMMLDMNNVDAFYIRGCAHQKLDELDKSLADFTRVLELDPNHINAAYAKGACQNRKGNLLQALDDYTLALEIDTERPLSPPSKIRNYSIGTASSFSTISTTENDEKKSQIAIKVTAVGYNENTEDIINSAYALKKVGRFDEALSLYNKAILMDENCFKGWFGRAYIYDKLNRVQEAIRDYTKAIQIMPQNAFVYNNRGICYNKVNEFDSAIRDFNAAIRITPKKADFYYNRGFVYMKLDNYVQAIEDFNKTLVLQEDNYKAYTYRAVCWDKLGESERARKDIFIALSLKPGDPKALEISNKLHSSRIIPRRSTEPTQIRVRVASPAGQMLRTSFVSQLLSIPDVPVCKSRATSSSNETIDTSCSRAILRLQHQDFENAISLFTEAISLDPRNCLAYNGRAEAYRKLNRLEDAISDYTTEIGIKPTSSAYNSRAFCLSKLERYLEAIADLDYVIDHEPDNIHAHYNRALAYQKIKNYSQAIADFTKVIQQQPYNASAHFSRGCCLEA